MADILLYLLMIISRV